MKKKESALSNAKIAIIFFVFLAFFISLSIVFKLIMVVSLGRFDDSKRFTLSIGNSKDTEAISFSSSSKSIAIVKLDKDFDPSKTGKFLEIPIDGHIISNSLDLNQTVNSLVLKSILNYNNLKTNLTFIDLLKIFFFARSVPESSIITKNISENLSSADIDKIVGRLVSEELIEKDNKTIQIINGTEVGGLGNRLARLIANIGGDVIIVATSDSPKKISSIMYFGKKTYTVERLSKILGYKAVKSAENTISDITITIGEDSANSSLF